MAGERAAPPGTAGPEGSDSLAAAAAALTRSLDSFDEPSAQAAIDRLLGAFTIETALRQVILPYLHDLGDRWARGQATVAQEHFASNLLRGRLAGLARGWGSGRGPLAILACAPAEQHDLALMSFGIVLHRQGWRVRYLGPDTPVAELVRAARELRPDLVVVTAAAPQRLPAAAALAEAAALAPLALAGAGASRAAADEIGARLLTGDPVTEAELALPPAAG